MQSQIIKVVSLQYTIFKSPITRPRGHDVGMSFIVID